MKRLQHPTKSKQPSRTGTQQAAEKKGSVSPSAPESWRSAKHCDPSKIQPLHFNSPSPSTASGVAQRPPLPQRGLDAFIGNGFECRLFDEPIGGMHSVSSWGHGNHNAAQGNSFVSYLETFERTPHMNVSQIEDRRHPQNQCDLAAEPWGSGRGVAPSNTAGSNSQLLGRMSFSPNSVTTKKNSDQKVNIRCGSKVVCGLTNSSRSKCAVRVLFVNHAMISGLRARMAQHASALDAAQSPVKSGPPVIAQDASPPAEDVVCTAHSSADDADEKADDQKKNEEVLPDDFTLRLQLELEQTFSLGAALAPVEMPDFLHLQAKTSALGLPSKGSADLQKSVGEAISVEVPSYHARNETRQSLSLATTGSEGSGNALDSVHSKSHTGPMLGMPVMGVSVFSLNDHGSAKTIPSTPVLGAVRQVQKRTSPRISAKVADTSQHVQQSNQHHDHQQQHAVSPVAVSSPANTPVLSTRSTQRSVAQDEAKRGAATRCAESPQWDMLNMSPLDKADLVGADATGFSTLHQSCSAPVFAIAMSMPFVRQGSLQTLFFDWVRAQRPSLVQREMVVRNIIYAVLQQLAVLHRCGAVHGSVKATNVFVAAHVLEALGAFSSHRADTATDAICTLLGSSGSKLSALAASGSQRTPTFSRVLASSVASTAVMPPSGDLTESEGESISGPPHSNAADMMEWTKHVILSDGHYARVEAALFAAIDSDRSCSVEGRGSTNECNAGSSNISDPKAPLLVHSLSRSSFSASATASGSGTASCMMPEELLVFTPEELAYVPPPESIIPEPLDDAPDAVVKPLPFRATNNTHCPLTPLSPSYDVWMVGMLAIHLADGGLPTWMKRQHSPLPRLRPGSWSVRFASFVQRCACADPAQRPTVDELLRDKWFQTVLHDDSAPRRPLMSVRTHAPSPPPQPPLHVSRMPCRRAFVDLLVEYHEYAEDWAVRVARSVNETVVRHSTPPPGEALPSAQLSDEDPPDIAKTLRREPDEISPVKSKRFSSPHSTVSGGGSTRSRSATSESGSLARQSLAIACDESQTTSELLPPSFLGAFSVALETCLCEIAVGDKDSDDTRLDAEEEQRQQHQQDLSGQLLQAFWNMHRECRLSADMWCLALMRQMVNDGRTAQLVAPILTEETQQCFATQAETSETAVANSAGTGGKPVSKTAITSGSARGMGQVSQLPSQQQQSQKQVVDVSPTAFHNYMFCKWCVTTSWALQQQQIQQPQMQQDRCTNVRRRR